MAGNAVKVRTPSGWVDLAYVATGPQGPAGPVGPQGAQGQLLEYACVFGWGATLSVAGGTAKTLPLGAATSSAPAGAFQPQADNGVLIRDAGYYACFASIYCQTATSCHAMLSGAPDSWGYIGESYDATSGQRIYTVAGVQYFAAGARVYANAAPVATATCQLRELSIVRVGAGPIGPKGDRGDPGATPGAIPVRTSIPTSPVNGEEMYLQTAAMATAGILWHFRYNGAVWQFLGGHPWRIPGGAAFTAAGNNTWQAWTNGPTFVVPWTGVWRFVTQAIYLQANAAGLTEGRLSWARNGTNVGKTAGFVATAQWQEGPTVCDSVDIACVAGETVRLNVYAYAGGFSAGSLDSDAYAECKQIG